MLNIWILTAQLNGGFSMMPIGTEIDCLIALASLPPAIVTEAECYPVEMIKQSGSRLAPEMAPLPVRKPVQDT